MKRPTLHNKPVGVSGPKNFRDFRETGPWDLEASDVFLDAIYRCYFTPKCLI